MYWNEVVSLLLPAPVAIVVDVIWTGDGFDPREEREQVNKPSGGRAAGPLDTKANLMKRRR